MAAIKKFFQNLYFSFPVQLLLLHVKTHTLLLLFWILLFMMVTNTFGKDYGVPYLFLDPEYLGNVSYLSFTIVGATFGAFMVAWNISTYLLSSYRFPFLATLERPFSAFSLNNSLIPLAFAITYLVLTVKFQQQNEFVDREFIVLEVFGFLSGMVVVLFLTTMYFQTTNKNLSRMFKIELKELKRIRKRVVMKQTMLWEEMRNPNDGYRVDIYLTAAFRLRQTRGIEHYDKKMLQSVFKQNHFNALVIELISIILLFAMGFLLDNTFFRIPAGASILLILSVMVSLVGVFSFWLRGWEVIAVIVLVIGANFLIQKGYFQHQNKAFGMDYESTPADYSIEKLEKLSSFYKVEEDKALMTATLDKWKARTGEEKPKMVLLNFSGGGLSAAMFTMKTLQIADSLTDGELMEHTVMMTGASGGMMGAAYFRDLYWKQMQGGDMHLYDPVHTNNIGSDLLNPVAFSIVVNDLFYPLRKFNVGGYSYLKDRGYVFEQQLIENCGGLLSGSLRDYVQPEQDAIIPTMVFSPTILNDERKLLVSAQPVSYLMRPVNQQFKPPYSEIDAVDFQSMFAENDPLNLQMSTALRMNATYPYILPNVGLPSSPMIKVYDAGFRDNYGMENSTRFVNVFADWILENTSGVVLIQVRAIKKDREIEKYEQQTVVTRLLEPIVNLYSDFTRVQDYNHNYLVSAANERLNGNLQVVFFEYAPGNKEEEASLSFHLTSKEKMEILKTVQEPAMQASFEQLKQTLEVTP